MGLGMGRAGEGGDQCPKPPSTNSSPRPPGLLKTPLLEKTVQIWKSIRHAKFWKTWSPNIRANFFKLPVLKTLSFALWNIRTNSIFIQTTAGRWVVGHAMMVMGMGTETEPKKERSHRYTLTLAVLARVKRPGVAPPTRPTCWSHVGRVPSQ